MKKNHIFQMLILGTLSCNLFADWVPFAIIGGGAINLTDAPYAALIREDGSLREIEGLLEDNGLIYSASMNASGISLIGGGNQGGFVSPPYAALVSSSGRATTLSGLTASLGYFSSVALNNDTIGILGGQLNGGELYAIKMAPTGIVEPILGLPLSGNVAAVALNSAGIGLIGGKDDVNSGQLAAIIPVSGPAVMLFGITPPNGEINSVALNHSGVGLLGGKQGPASNEAYAAIVKPDNTVVSLPLALGVNSSIDTVALNNSGQGFVGGLRSTGLYFASVDSTLETISEISISSLSYQMTSVAINDAGVCLAGTGPRITPIAALAFLINQDQEITFLQNLPSDFIVLDTAINNYGVGLIGGAYFSSGNFYGYTAIVAPDGSITSLSGAFQQNFNGIAATSIINERLFLLVPEAIGNYLIPMNTHLSVNNALEAHLTRESGMAREANLQNKELSYVTDVQGVRGENQKKNGNHETQCNLWASPFGSFIHEDQNGVNPSYSNDVAGLLVAFDYSYNEFIVGAGAGYAYNYFEYGANFGHGHLQEETLVCYGVFQKKHLWANVAFWGGMYQLYNKRFTLGYIPSESNTHGWIVSPHMELALPFSFLGKERFLEPFVMVDWVNNWQNKFTETGISGLNLIMKNKYTSLVRVETGARRYETVYYNWGKIVVEEKLSYVNQTPVHFEPMTTSFVASNSTFPIAIGSAQVQNMIGAEFHATVVPANQRIPYFSLDLQGNWGKHYQSYYIGLELGRTF